MTMLRVAAVQAAPVLMDLDATLARVADLTRDAADDGAELVVFPEAFVPGPPVWIDTARIWEGDAEWYGLLADQAVVVPWPGHGKAWRHRRRRECLACRGRQRARRWDDL